MRFLAGLARSFRCAGRGLWLAIQGRNLRIMSGVLLAVVVLAASLEVSATRWAVLLVCASVVLTSEILNTSIERLADYVEREYDEDIRAVKDLAAGAALLASGIAATIGVIVFWPYVIK